MIKIRTVEDLAESIARAKGECIFLIGAGFSVSGGIPLASELVGLIKKQFPRAYDRARSEDYNCVMGELTPHQRAELLKDFIDNAKVNWAHLALAQLFEANKIDRILTVNFDPLALKACSMVGEFPAVYDLATASEFKGSRISTKSIFYLNGQHTGFAMFNSADELDEHKNRLDEIVKNTGSRRIWVLVGYSGEADPLADTLTAMAKSGGFDNGLYWVGHNKKPSGAQAKLLENNNTFYIGDQDADKFMDKLAQQLDCFPPPLLTDPFYHIESTLSKNIDFSTGGQYAEELYSRLSSKLKQARLNSEKDDETSIELPDLSKLVLSGNYDKVFELWSEHGEGFSENQKGDVAWAYVMTANKFANDASSFASSNLAFARELWAKAAEGYEKALKIKPNMNEALNNWGCTLDAEANLIVDIDLLTAKELWSLAGDKYEQTLLIKPSDYEALVNWGCSLGSEAWVVASNDMKKACQLWSQAGNKFERALELKPNMHEAFNSWGVVLDAEAKKTAVIDLERARYLWSEAIDRYKQALEIKPDKYLALNNWGLVLSAEARAIANLDLNLARYYWSKSQLKYEQALSINPNMYEAMNNWGLALFFEANAIAENDTIKARQLLSESVKKYEQALNEKPDSYQVLTNWGNSLNAEAGIISKLDKDLAAQFWHEAKGKYNEALSINPDNYESLFNLGTLLDAEAKVAAMSDIAQAKELWMQSKKNYERALLVKPDGYETMHNLSNALLAEYHCTHKLSPVESLTLLSRVSELLERGTSLAPGQLAYNYACYWSVKGDSEQSVHWLKIAKEHQELPSQQHIDEDVDFDNIRESQVFFDWYESEFGNHVDS